MKRIPYCRILSIYLFCLALIPVSIAQQQSGTPYRMTLEQVIELAQSDAPDVLLAKTRYATNYWTYQSFLANYKPQIDLEATFPNLNRSIEPITLPSGEDEFINRSLMRNSLNISMSQNVAATGGTIFASTGLQRIDVFETSFVGAGKSYLSTPISVGFIQPLFAYNELKWDKLIDPIAFDEAKQSYSEEIEETAFNATQYFFDVLTAQLNAEASEREKANADTLLEIGRGRYSVGKIAETELLQLELGSMKSEAALASAQLEVQTSMEALRNFLGIKEALVFDLITPDEIPDFEMEAQEALKWAHQNRSITQSFRRRLAEAERDIARAEGERFNIDIFGRLGLTQTGSTLSSAYQNPLDQEQVRIGINMPIADWGKAKAKLEIAKSMKELTELNVELEKVNFERQILIKVQQFQLVKNQVVLATKTYEAAQKQFDLTQKRYLIGKIGITDLNLAVSEREGARQGYVSALQKYWFAYYEMRGLTLYDFEKKQPLVVDVPDY
jgi:outer membrane protein TolC